MIKNLENPFKITEIKVKADIDKSELSHLLQFLKPLNIIKSVSKLLN